MAKGYDAQLMMQARDETARVKQDVADLRHHAESLQRRAAAWIISALLAAVASLLLMVVKLKAPWMLTP